MVWQYLFGDTGQGPGQVALGVRVLFDVLKVGYWWCAGRVQVLLGVLKVVWSLSLLVWRCSQGYGQGAVESLPCDSGPMLVIFVDTRSTLWVCFEKAIRKAARFLGYPILAHIHFGLAKPAGFAMSGPSRDSPLARASAQGTARWAATRW